MRDVKIVEGTAEYIKEVGGELDGYELDSLQFTHRGRIYTNDDCTVVSESAYNFYVAVFKK